MSFLSFLYNLKYMLSCRSFLSTISDAMDGRKATLPHGGIMSKSKSGDGLRKCKVIVNGIIVHHGNYVNPKEQKGDKHYCWIR